MATNNSQQVLQRYLQQQLLAGLGGGMGLGGHDPSIGPINDPLTHMYNDAMALYQQMNYKEAFTKWKYAAERGHAHSQHDTADCYRMGHGIQQDYIKAQDWYRKAVAQEQPKSMAHLGTLLKHGFGSPVDKSAAVGLWTRSSAFGSQEATRELAVSYLSGDGVDQNYEKANQLFEKVRSIPYCVFELGLSHELGRGTPVNLNAARNCYQQAVQSRQFAAHLFALARLMLLSPRSDADDYHAFQHMTRITQIPNGGLNGSDHRSAYVWLGWMCAVGRGVTRDVARALTFYQRARGDARALRHIALLKNDPEARPVAPSNAPCDPTDEHHIRGVGRGRWSIVNLHRASNDTYFVEKELRTRDLDMKRELALYQMMNDDDATYVLIPHRIELNSDTNRYTVRYTYQSGGSLADVMTQYHEAKERIPEATLVAWAHQILSGLECIYLRGGAHRHLTPRNILFTDEKRQSVKIADVGVIGSPFTSPVPLTDAAIRGYQSVYVSAYAPPEQLGAPERRPPFTIAGDVWAVGQILVEAISGHFSGNVAGEPWLASFDEEELEQFLLSNRGDYSDNLINRVLSLLRHDPNERYTIDKAVAAFAELVSPSDTPAPTPDSKSSAPVAPAAPVVTKPLKVLPPQPIMGAVLAPLPPYYPHGHTPASSTGTGASLSSGLSSGSLSSNTLSSNSLSSMSSFTPPTAAAPRSPSASLSSGSLSSSGTTATASSPSPLPAAAAAAAPSTPPAKRRDIATMSMSEQWQQLLYDQQPLIEWNTLGVSLAIR